MIKILLVLIFLFANPTTDTTEAPIVKVYPVQDLLVDYKDFLNAPELDLNAALLNQNNIFKSNSASATSIEKNANNLIDIIKNTIEPEIWYDEATITYFRGNLIIKAPLRVHKQIL